MKLLRPGMVSKFIAQPVKQIIDREIDELRMYRPGFQLIDVEQRVEHARHGGGRLVEARDERQGLFLLVVPDFPCQDTAHQAEGLQRLPEVVARGGEKAGLGDIGLLCFPLGGLQRVGGASTLGDIGKGDDDALDPIILGAIGQYSANVP